MDYADHTLAIYQTVIRRLTEERDTSRKALESIAEAARYEHEYDLPFLAQEALTLFPQEAPGPRKGILDPATGTITWDDEQ